ncbi:hypothetical protein BGZ46_009195 [Entomortierella lignicola]|nr:hypothetical protein BGZ46_009195 [Entomortierella lignicola]
MPQGSCPNLQHLTWGSFGYHSSGSLSAKEFINASAGGLGLKTFKCKYYNEEEHDDDIDAEPDDENLIETLLRLHSKTLENVEFLQCITATNLGSVLTQCRKLKRLWTTIYSPDCKGVGLDYEVIISYPWVCLGLKELCIMLGKRDVEISEDDYYYRHFDSDGHADMVGKKVYAQIGRLVNLETLGIGHDVSVEAEDEPACDCDLTLKHGYLGQLRRLRKLRHLYMVTDFWTYMGQAEVEFMYKYWPLLKKITFGEANSTADLKNKPHWQWLQKKRPNLQYACGEILL